MAQFQVPQFIEVEDKIVGPLTLKQFLFLAAAGLISFLTFFIFTFTLWLIVTVLVGAIGAAFAFGKYNGQPIYIILISALKYLWQPKLYLWKRKDATGPEIPETHEIKIGREERKRTPLKDLWLKLLTTTRNIPKREKVSPVKPAPSKEQYEIVRKTTGEREAIRRIDYR